MPFPVPHMLPPPHSPVPVLTLDSGFKSHGLLAGGWGFSTCPPSAPGSCSPWS
jgi:hypothetical protein